MQNMLSVIAVGLLGTALLKKEDCVCKNSH